MNGVFLLLGLTMLAGTGARAAGLGVRPGEDERRRICPPAPGRKAGDALGLGGPHCHGFRNVSKGLTREVGREAPG